jgi:manganese efflux pump family protein
VLALIPVAVSVGLTNFAGALAIGISGVDARLRVRVALAFGLFEGGMSLLGLLLGRGVASVIGSHSDLLAAILLCLIGLYTMLSVRRARLNDVDEFDPGATGRLLATALALSVDNLAVGFALGTYHVSFVAAAAVIAAVSVALSLLGLELGDRIGAQLGRRSELLGGAILVGVGAAIGIGVI